MYFTRDHPQSLTPCSLTMGAGASVRKDGSKGKADSSHEVASDTEDSSAVTTANEGDSAARGGAGEPARVRAFEHADNCTSAGQDPASCALLDNASPGKSPPESRSRKALPRCRSHVNGEFVSEEVDDASPRSAEDALPNKQQSMDLSRGVARSSSLDAGDLEAEDIEEGDLEAIDRESSAHSHQSGAAAPTKLVTTEDASASPLPSNAAAEVLRPKHHVNETPANRRSGGQLPPLARRPTSPHAFEGGILEVTILGASGVKQMDLTSKSDVYAVVTFGLEEVRTSVRKDVADCDWGEDGLGEWAWFFVPSTATERLEMRISLWDEDVPAHQVGASLYNRKKATSHGDDFIGSSVVQVESIRRKARLNRRMPSLGDAAAGLEQRKVEVKDKFGVVTGTVYYSVRMLNRREEVSGTFWRTLLRVVDCDGDASSVSQDDALALLEFLQAKKKVRAAVMQRMFGVSDPHEIVRHDVAGISESSDNSGRRGTKVNQVVHDASDLGLVEAVNSSPQSVSGDQQQGGGGQAVVETLSIPAAVEALVEVSSNYDLVSARFPADVVTGRSLAGLTPFEKECYLLQSLDHGNSNRMTSVASKDDRLHNSWMASLANDWNPPQNEQHSFVSSRQVRNRATGMMEDEYISSMVWLSLKAIYSKLFLEGISGLLDLMTAKMNKEARDPKQGKDLIAHFVKQCVFWLMLCDAAVTTRCSCFFFFLFFFSSRPCCILNAFHHRADVGTVSGWTKCGIRCQASKRSTTFSCDA